MNKPNIYNHLLKHGVKPSIQRVAILDYLMSHRTHPTVDVIYTSLCPSYPTLSRMTVYNTLKLLVEHGAIQMLTIDDKQAHYDADISQHAHFRCHSCGTIYDVEAPLLTPLQSPHFEVYDTQIYYHGLCNKCKQ